MQKYKAIAEVIENRMRGLGMRKIDLAKQMSAPPASVTKWLSGEHNFTIDTLFKIEEILKIKIINPYIPDTFNHRQNHSAHSI